jgi:hypothetical protein
VHASHKGHLLCHLEALVHEGRQALAIRVLETFQLEQKTHKGSDAVAPVPIAGELLRTAAGDVWTLVLRDEIKGRSVLRPLLSDLPLTGYISRSTRQRSLRQLSGVRIRTIENVVPGHLTDTDWMDFSLLRYIDVQFADPAAGSHTESTPLTYDNREPVFPEGTTGFLYVHVPDPAHPIGAQLRFRLVSEPNPAGFASGRDLHRPNGEVWYCWLPTLVRRASGQAIASIVTRQGLVDRGVVEQWQAETGAASCVKAFSPLVCPGSAPFSLDLSRYRQGLIVGAGMRARFVQITSPFAHQRLRVKAAPFSGRLVFPLQHALRAHDARSTGRALVQLEENPAQKTYNMRVLEVSDLHVPPAYDGPVPIPKLGVFQLRSGRKLWTTMQKMLAEQR